MSTDLVIPLQDNPYHSVGIAVLVLAVVWFASLFGR